MKINVRYKKEADTFEIQIVEKKLRAHFLLSRSELNHFRTILEKALVESRGKDKKKK
ncbi:MAG: hypothetical protein GF408_02470 [Candidatus Omnitrophica bacterium]|nr:hypothetical protein [Candidatus Omnitrophota bacterium]